ncbi:MAG: type II toxin-antitoxin system RelE/ParE family toxin [Candidatus Entotheonellia bacterium]
MPPTAVVFYQEEDGSVPLQEWLDRLPAKAQAKCLARLKRLEDLGHELRASLGGVHYRILYFFYSNIVAVVSHGMTKEHRVPPREIERAIERKSRFTTNPPRYMFRPELS